MGRVEEVGWVLWAGTVGLDSPLPMRIDAAVAGSFDRLSVSPLDVAGAVAAGSTISDLGRRIRDEGLGIVLDPVMGWHNDVPGPGPYAAFPLEEVLRMGEALGAAALTVLGPFSPGEATDDELERRFGALCDRAGSFGARVQLEFMPFTVIGDVRAAWSIVDGAGRDNGGLVVDTWHFFRGNPDLAALESLPGERIFAVQVADGGAEPKGSVAEDTFHRRLPGDGVFDLEAVLATLARVDALWWVGPEVISPETAAMAPRHAARLAGERVRDLVAAAIGTL
jgi:sugar phosphate isomerase/epimerase